MLTTTSTTLTAYRMPTAGCLLRDAVVDTIARPSPLGPRCFPDLTAVIPVAVPVLEAVGAPAVSKAETTWSVQYPKRIR